MKKIAILLTVAVLSTATAQQPQPTPQQQYAAVKALEKLVALDDWMNDEENGDKRSYVGAYYAYYIGKYETWKKARSTLATIKGAK